MNKYPGVYEVKDSSGNIVKNKYVLRLCLTVNGKTHRDTRTITASTLKKAYDEKLKIINELKEQYSKGSISNNSNMTMSELIKIWKEKTNSKYSPNTFNGYEKLINRYIEPMLGTVNIKDISKGTLVIYQDNIREKNPNLSNKSIRNQMMLIRTILTFAEEREWIEYNPCSKIKMSRIEASEPVYFTDEQMIKIMKELDDLVETKINSFDDSVKYSKLSDDERLKKEHIRTAEVMAKRLFIHLSLITGARRGETIGLRWNDIQFSEAKIEFKGSVYNLAGLGSQYKNKLKNGDKLKTVYINENIIPMLKEYKHLQKKVIAEQGWKDTGHVFIVYRNGRTMAAGQLARPNTYSHWFSDWCWKNRKKLGLTDQEAKAAHVHMLRHSFISYELNNGTNLRVVASLAGHKDATMTANVYGHSYDSRMKEAADVFNSLYEKKDII